MPWARLEHPSIQLGLLQAVLARAEIPSEVRSLYLTFMEFLCASTAERPEAEQITVVDYAAIASQYFIGDWIFSVPPFNDYPQPEAPYFEYLRAKGTAERLIEKAAQIRQLVPAFLERTVADILAATPAIVGFTTTFGQNVPSLVLAKLLKARDPSLIVVLGGANCDGEMGATLHRLYPWVDIVVRGEGERVVPELFADLLLGGPIRPHPGLCYRQGDQSLVIDLSPESTVAMNELPMPQYDEYFEGIRNTSFGSSIIHTVSIPFESARGCWWGAKAHCTFCGLNGSTMAFRSKSSERAAAELFTLSSRHQCLSFQAVDNILDMRYFGGLLPLLRDSGYDFKLFYETKSNLRKEQLRILRQAGVADVQPGIESLSTPILKMMRKGVTAFQNICILKWCAELDIRVFWNVIYGFPGEPIEEYGRMADVMKSLSHLEPPSLIPLGLERFSPYHENPDAFGLEITGPLPHYRFIYPAETEADLCSLAYSFAYRHADGRRPETYVEPVKEVIDEWRERYAVGFGSLRYRLGPGFMVINDRRPNLETCDYRLGEREARIYLACDEGSTAASIWSGLQAAGDTDLTTQDVEDFLGLLEQSRLVYEEGGRYLSLALRAGANVAAS
jgi:ribosomal peptide maturation radical SAM protein 1